MTERRSAHAPRTASLTKRAAAIPRCIDCPGCTGMCAALIELMTLPEAVVR